MSDDKQETMRVFVVRNALHGPTLKAGLCTVDIERPKPSGNAILDKLLVGSVRGPCGTLYDADYRSTETEARAAICDMIAKDRERLRAALAKLDRLKSELDSGAPLFTTHIEPLPVA